MKTDTTTAPLAVIRTAYAKYAERGEPEAQEVLDYVLDRWNRTPAQLAHRITALGGNPIATLTWLAATRGRIMQTSKRLMLWVLGPVLTRRSVGVPAAPETIFVAVRDAIEVRTSRARRAPR